MATSTPTASQEANINTPAVTDQFLFNCNYLLQFCRKFDTINGGDQTESIIETKSRDLEIRWAKVETAYERVMLSSESEVSADFKQIAQEQYDSCLEAYYACNSQALDIIKASRADTQQFQGLESTSRCYMPPQNFSHEGPNTCIKVPPCDTEIFYGSYEQWPSFRDMFTAVYINHSKLSPVTKLYHLRNKTQGEAGAIVKRYTLSDNNFDLAWNALRTRYENKRVLVDNQIKILFDIPPATSEDSESIRRIQSSVDDSLATLTTLGIQVESWDPILIHLISTKLPEFTLSLWEQSLMSPRELPKWSQMSQFLVDRYEAVERLASVKSTKGCFKFVNSSKADIQTYSSQEQLNPNCKLCSLDHPLRKCPKFGSFTVQQRIDYVYKHKFCNNCLSPSHLKTNCKSKNTCFHCKRNHHTLLHMKRVIKNLHDNVSRRMADNSEVLQPRSISRNSTSDIPSDELPRTSGQVQANFASGYQNVLLRTALVQIEHRGDCFTVRALIDPGSQRTFITERIRSRLQLPYEKAHFEITGIGGQTQFANRECEFILYAKRYNIRVPVKAIVLPRVTRKLPAYTFEVPVSPKLLQLDLADPNFNVSSQIDLILGNDYEHFLNLEGIQKNICSKTSAYNTIFGWVLSGPMKGHSIQTFTTSVVSSDTSDLQHLLRKFWEQEDFPIIRERSEEDDYCEELYSRTTERNKSGKYIVRLPFRKDFPQKVFLGSSRFLALGQYMRMEKTIAKDSDLREQYNAVLREYISLDHMEETSSREEVAQGKFNSYYLPHHAVVRPDHKTTKLRVVFNASRKTKSQFSLNDVLCTGPTLQRDLITIILNWRKYQYVFSADIQKMYRQILVHPKDRPFQRILFQNEPAGPIRDFQLKTVTFGVNCAPYLAIRTLHQIASDYELSHPRACDILLNETYVDDILSGGHTLEDTLHAQKQLIQVLNAAGMPLKKFTANNRELLAHLTKDDLYDQNFLRFHDSSSTKTLGIKWDALSDCFNYNFKQTTESSKLTKRVILSAVAKLFDPAGWLAPIIIKAKLLMQQLWLEGVDWDEEISAESQQKWNNFVLDISEVNTIHIPRWLQLKPTDVIQIHGFSDASKAAYCATVYVRCQTPTQTVFTNLLVAKSKVAPIQTISLPRLELNGAVLLAKLVNEIVTSLNFQGKDIHLWTDSTIVLGWLSKAPSTWETFVANRVSRIHQLVPKGRWRHVSTHDNPADVGTRGCKPSELKLNLLWWQGPPWLSRQINAWPNTNPLTVSANSERVQLHHVSVHDNDILENFSSYCRALRVICYMFRFFNRISRKCGNPQTLTLTHQEIKFVRDRLITISQKTHFGIEYSQLTLLQQLPPKSSLKPLNPFLDSSGILRVNGRLSQSSLPYNESHPIILPGNSRFCHLYLTHLHHFLQHAECTQICRMTQTEFYVSKLKSRVKSVIRHCKVCTIFKQQPCTQIMAPLPSERCQLSPPFQITGIDFAGPIDLKTSTLRNSSLTKGYVCVFVCFCTKAIHLEPCSDLSSAAFQAAFCRFVGRRGLPQKVVSDNGRNFIGASRTLLREFTLFIKSAASDLTHKYIAHGFEWKFIPPYAPHMGGLWEAAVKSFKFHFKRVSGAQKYNFEEFSTILARIEGVLNSRPISAVSEDPADLTALTPGHFLRGAPIMAFPEQTIRDMSVINRWEKLKALHHNFALRWKEDYLKSLHKRYKWRNTIQNLKVGDLVVVMDELQPPCVWRLGRVLQTFPGSDSQVRIAQIRTATGAITRPITKLCYLPCLDDNTNPSNE